MRRLFWCTIPITGCHLWTGFKHFELVGRLVSTSRLFHLPFTLSSKFFPYWKPALAAPRARHIGESHIHFPQPLQKCVAGFLLHHPHRPTVTYLSLGRGR